MSTGNLEQYKIIKIIGQGAYGKVYKALHIPSNTIVALKSMKMEEDNNMLHQQLVMLSREL